MGKILNKGSPALERIVEVVDGNETYQLSVPLYHDSPDYPKSVCISAETLVTIPGIPDSPIHTYHLVEADDGKLLVLKVPACSKAPKIPELISEAEARHYGAVMPGDTQADDIQTIPFKLEMPVKTEIYQPVPIDKSEFTIALTNRNAERLGVEIYQDFAKRFVVRVYCEDFYLFNMKEGIYEKVTDADFDRIINQFYGEKIADVNNLQAYNDIRDYLRKDYRLAVKEEALLPPNYWVFRNGIVNIVNGERISNHGQFFITSVLQDNYDPMASCPRFDQYVRAVSGGDDAIAARLREVTAYLLSRDTNAKTFFEIVGKKDTGKSVYGRLLTGLIGKDSISYLSANDFSDHFAVAELNGRQLNLCMDLPDTPLSASTVGRIKAITGQDMIRSDVKYKPSVYFKSTARLVFASNSRMRTEVYDPAFNERKIFIPFNYPIPKDKQVFSLDEELISEASGIFNEMIPYYLGLVEKRYHFTEIDWSDSDELTIDQDIVIKSMAKEMLTFTEDTHDRISTDRLYQLYVNYCSSKTIEPLTLTKFSERFRKLFSDQTEKKKVRIGNGSVWGFIGVKFKT